VFAPEPEPERRAEPPKEIITHPIDQFADELTAFVAKPVHAPAQAIRRAAPSQPRRRRRRVLPVGSTRRLAQAAGALAEVTAAVLFLVPNGRRAAETEGSRASDQLPAAQPVSARSIRPESSPTLPVESRSISGTTGVAPELQARATERAESRSTKRAEALKRAEAQKQALALKRAEAQKRAELRKRDELQKLASARQPTAGSKKPEAAPPISARARPERPADPSRSTPAPDLRRFDTGTAAALGQPIVPPAEASPVAAPRDRGSIPSEATPARPLATGTSGNPGTNSSTPNPAVDPRVVDRDKVRAVLSRYESAYSQLDAAAAARLYPAVDRKALSRAFNTLSSQQIQFADCRIQVGTSTAHATCAGTASWTPKVGGGSREQSRRWQFDLKQVSGDWQIGAVKVQ
jgi:hypothetical protein